MFVPVNFGREVALMNSSLGDALKIVQVVVVTLKYLVVGTAVAADVV